ncbi:MAG: Unknown protein [uncultured Sulfurovum sp.]|uniref:Uncharacterized protein n=1 Tax=uncultured Sulfurovum sp. TaxID=269237 RepID=A0A6S6TEV6_9BACT|nr:MAG: Unknown protein [uncultured Sulfurovum sp.]
MNVTADNPQILQEMYLKLDEQGIKLHKSVQKIEGAKGDIVAYLALGVSSLGLVLQYLSYLQTQKKHSLFYKYKDSVDTEVHELRFDNLTKEELNEKIKNIQDDFDKLEKFHIG